MGFLLEIKKYFPSFRAKSDSLDVFTDGTVQRWGTRTTRIRYDENSAFTAYRTHELVFACINKIADVMNDAEIIVEVRNSKGEWEPKQGHMLNALFKRPNNYQTGRDVRKLMVQSEQGMGRFYAHVERSAAGVPVLITVLNPNRIQPRYDATETEVLFYDYLAKDGRRIPLKKEDLFIRRRPDLLDQFNGFAPLDAALRSINSDLGFTDYVDAFFESDGTPSGILKILNQTVPETKREALQALWRKKYSRGGSHQKGVAVLDQNAEFQKIGSNLDELASDSLSGRFEARICSVFGVPPNLVGAYVGLLHVTANATAKAELQNFWENKISGELSVLREWLTWFVLPEFEDIETIRQEKVRVGFDISHVAFLQEDLDKIHERARKNLQAGGWTLNEFREATGKMPDPDGDYYLQPVNLAALSPENRAAEAFERVEAGKDPKEQEKLTEGDDAADDDAKLQRQISELIVSEPEKKKKTYDFDGLILGREPRGVEVVIDLKKIVSDYDTEKERVAKILQKFRIELILQATSKLDKLTPETAYTLTLTPDPKRRKEIAKALQSAYKTGRGQIIEEINHQKNAKNGGNNYLIKADDDPDWLEYIDELTDGLVSRIINEITSRAVNQYLALKLLVDYAVEKLTEALLGQSEKFIEQIAGGTVNAAISEGRDDEIDEQIAAGEIEYTEYSAILDANTCGPCEDADGLTATDPSDLPAAPNPECEGGANCRCFHIGVIV